MSQATAKAQAAPNAYRSIIAIKGFLQFSMAGFASSTIRQHPCASSSFPAAASASASCVNSSICKISVTFADPDKAADRADHLSKLALLENTEFGQPEIAA